MLSTAGSSPAPPSAPRGQAPLPLWPVLRGDPVPEALLADRVWLEPPRRRRWAGALRRLVGRRARSGAPAPASTHPAPTAAPPLAPVPVVVPPSEADHPTQEAA